MSYGVKRPKDNWTWVLEEEEALKHLKVGSRRNGLAAFHSPLRVAR
jgi:hypothetical protein